MSGSLSAGATPAWLLHQVRPYRGNAERISIAFNLTV